MDIDHLPQHVTHRLQIKCKREKKYALALTLLYLTGPCPLYLCLSICLSESSINESGHYPISCSHECCVFVMNEVICSHDDSVASSNVTFYHVCVYVYSIDLLYMNTLQIDRQTDRQKEITFIDQQNVIAHNVCKTSNICFLSFTFTSTNNE